ncbi:MAG: nitroreductase family protein [Vulcanibacillus sp.]
MTIVTSRANSDGRITIDANLCTGCGLCVDVCKDFSIKLKDGKAIINDEHLFGCIACGHCVAVCPFEAIMVEGRTLSKKDFVDIPDNKIRSNYEQLYSLMKARRSIRDFEDKEVEEELINQILEASVTAPMGIPPSSVEVLVLNGKEKVREFSFEFIDYIKGYKRFINPITISALRPFLGKQDYDAYKTFIIPMINFFIETREKNENYLLYDAPLALYFYGASTDPADPYIAATYAMLAAESLGLGSCMIGSINPFLKYGGKHIKNKYQINSKVREGIFVIFGYPKFSFTKSINRTFENVNFI